MAEVPPPEPITEGQRRAARACRACRRRKVKCSGGERCTECAHNSLRCEYSAGQGSRAGILRGVVLAECAGPALKNPVILPKSVAMESPLAGRTLAINRANVLKQLLPRYMKFVYPTHPVVNCNELLEHIDKMATDRQSEALVWACCAAVESTAPQSHLVSESVVWDLLNRAVQALQIEPFGFEPSVQVTLSYTLLANCLMALENYAAAFMYLRQAVCMVEMFRLDDPTRALAYPESELARLQRLYQVIWVHERYQAIAELRRPTLPLLSSRIAVEWNLPTGIQVGFHFVIRLFHVLDDEFVKCWLAPSPRSDITESWILQRLEACRKICEEIDSRASDFSSAQQADLTVTKYWLLSLLWRLALNFGLLVGDSGQTCFTSAFPIEILQQLRRSLDQLSAEAVSSNSFGIIQKVFEILDTAGDLLLFPSPGLFPNRRATCIDFLALQRRIIWDRLDTTRRAILEDKAKRVELECESESLL